MDNLLDEIIEACKGVDDAGMPKASITVSATTYNDETEEFTDNGMISSYGATTDVQFHSGYIRVDLTFKSPLHAELRTIWQLLERYGERVDAYSEEDAEVPMLSLTIVPLQYNGKYYCVCEIPIFWALQSHSPGEPGNTIRLLFEEDQVQFFEGDEYDVEKLTEAIEEQFAKEDAEIERMLAKDKEREDYLKQREALIEEVRRNRAE